MDHAKVKQSKSSIRQALLTLLEEKPIEKITISDLTREAKVNRSTFYSHYVDKFNLVEDLESYFINQINQTLDEQFKNNSIQNGIILSIQALVFFATEQNNFSFLKLMLSKNGDPKFASKITDVLSAKVSEAVKEKNELSVYICRFVSRGLLELLIVWLNEEKRLAPHDFIELVKMSQLNSPVELVLHE